MMVDQTVMKKGIFITIEGPDGAGKSTQIGKIKAFLEQLGRNVIVTREPGGTTISEKIREIILDKNNKEMDSMTEALLYAAARAQHVSQLIKPSLEDGADVICDRFVDSSIAYQAYGRGLGDSVWKINEYAIKGCMPDITFLLKIPPHIGKERILGELQDRIELENIEFHNRVYQGYEELDRQSERIIAIDATVTIDEINSEITRHLERLISQ